MIYPAMLRVKVAGGQKTLETVKQAECFLNDLDSDSVAGIKDTTTRETLVAACMET